MTKAAELAKMGEVLTNSQIGGRRNIVINGAMQVAQRSTSETGLGNSVGFKTVDRFKVNADTSAATAGRYTMSQVADVHDGFANALKFECTTADTSIAAGELFSLEYLFEGQDLQQLKKGTSDAEKVTVSFYVKGNANATYMLELKDTDNTRLIHSQFAVTTSWNRITITFNGDTTGTLDDDNAKSLELRIWLHAGSNYTSGTYTANTWASQTQANRAVGITSFFDSTDRTFFLTGLQMEVGSQATPFEHRSFGEELALCQRYFQKSYADNVAPSTVTNNGAFWTNIIRNASNQNYWHVQTYQTMRSQPSVTTHSPATGTSGKFENDTDGADRDSAVSNTSNTGFSIRPNSGTSNDLGDVVAVHWVADSEL